ncbi:MAG TPA: hypothetical protein VH231_12010 [Solirubrobacteraceae bacterium]|nr:hypothetical protein [Solirubrobacteraceae bacterium]
MFEYGTLLGQTYANKFPDRIRAMLLDSVVDPVPYSRSFESYVTDPGFGKLGLRRSGNL